LLCYTALVVVREKAVGTRQRKVPRRRAAWGSVTRELVVSTALRIVANAGYEQLTIRSLASEMGVAPMTLYHHVSSKDDLLDEVVDRLLGDVWRPAARIEKGWWAWLAEAAERFRQFLVDQPAALHVYLSHPVVSPAALARMDEMLRALRMSGLDEHEARRAYAALHSYTIGFAALQASRAGWRPAPGAKPIAYQLAAYTTPRQFKEGLRYVLEGIERRANAAGRPEPGAAALPTNQMTTKDVAAKDVAAKDVAAKDVATKEAKMDGRARS
jgi:AcrR family transcriptional regulator